MLRNMTDEQVTSALKGAGAIEEDVVIEQHKFEPFQKVLVRDKMKDEWEPDLFRRCVVSCISGEHIGFKCIGCGTYKYCIPYDGNEHLLGTTDSPEQKHEYKFGDKVEINQSGTWVKAIFIAHEMNEQYKTKCVTYILNGDVRVITNFTTDFMKKIRPLKED